MDKYRFKDTLNIPINLFKILGAWPTGNTVLYWLHTLLFCAAEISIPIFTLIGLINEEDFSVTRIANCIYMNMQLATVPFKTIFLVLSYKNMQRLLEALDSEVFNCYTHHHFNIIENGASAIRKIKHYIPLCIFTVALIVMMPIVHLKDMPLFMDMWFPFNPRNNWFRYWTAQLYVSGGTLFIRIFTLCQKL